MTAPFDSVRGMPVLSHIFRGASLGSLVALGLLLLFPAASAQALSEIHSTGALPRGVYICHDCSQADHDNAVAPSGYTLRFARKMLPSVILRRIALSGPPPTSAPADLDAIASIPGNEYELVATLNGVTPLGGGFALAQVARDSLWRYDGGIVIHEVFDPDGSAYVLFTARYSQLETLDPDQLDAFASLILPAGWSYSSRVLTQNLFVESTTVASVLFSPDGTLWQKNPAAASAPAALDALGGEGLLLLVVGLGVAAIVGLRFTERKNAAPR
ncbi:MAG: hypothetical protein VCB25_08400 [Myxococcota bacterium]